MRPTVGHMLAAIVRLQTPLPTVDDSSALHEPGCRAGEEHQRRKGQPKITKYREAANGDR